MYIKQEKKTVYS